MKTSTLSDQRSLLLRLVDEGFDKTAWHGPNLRSSLRQVPVEQAVWRSQPGRHCIAEIVVHCAYWKYAVRRRIRGDKRGTFPLKGSNWFTLPARLSHREWREYLALLDAEHASLRKAIAASPAPRLFNRSGGEYIPAPHVHGVAMHDIYHTGQIRMIKVLYKHLHRQGGKARKASR
ncbi:MAG: DinB family protein [Phycisphaerae bacterium]